LDECFARCIRLPEVFGVLENISFKIESPIQQGFPQLGVEGIAIANGIESAAIVGSFDPDPDEPIALR